MPITRFGLVGPSYTSRSVAIAAEECINYYAEPVESQGAVSPGRAYGGQMAQGRIALVYTPGMTVFATLPESPVRGQLEIQGRHFAVGGTKFCEVASDGTVTPRQTVNNDSNAVSMDATNTQILVVAAGGAYCFTLADNTWQDVTSKLLGVPLQVQAIDGYFIVLLSNGEFQVSSPLDGLTWPGTQVTKPSVFAEKPRSIIANHRELIVSGSRHAQPYGDTGSDNVFDVVQGTLIEQGSAARFGPCRADNTIFWISEDERGARQCWRASGYTPQRISTFAVEYDLSTYSQTQILSLVTYAYQDGGHLFWVIYIPGSTFSWVYDVATQLWHKRASWNGTSWGPHWSWNHAYAFGKHLLGDWNSANIYQITNSALDDAGTQIRRLRRSATVEEELEWVRHAELTLDIETGKGPAVPLTDESGNPRGPMCMVRWSDDRGHTWSNEHWIDCGQIGNFRARAILRRLGRSRYRVYEVSMTDPVPWILIDGFLRTA